MMACWSVALAFLLYRVAHKQFGVWAAIGLGLFFISLPVTQENTHSVMLDVFLALLIFLAVTRFVRYLEAGRWQDSAWFGILAALAILTKYNSFALALLPPLGVMLARKANLLRRVSFWLPAAIVMVLCGPWYLLNYDRILYAGEPYPLAGTIPGAIRGYGAVVMKMFGPAGCVFVAAGVWKRVILPWRRGVPPLWAALAALAMALWLFHTIAYSLVEPRYLLPAVPALVMFFGAGISCLTEFIRLHWLAPWQRTVLVSVVAAVCYSAQAFTIPKKLAQGYSRVVDHLLSTIDVDGTAILVSADVYGEGGMVSEMAMREQRNRHYVIRASKVLAISDEMGGRYRTLYGTDEEILQFLDTVPVSLLVFGSPPGNEHHRQLERAVNHHSDRWKRVHEFPAPSERSSSISVYSRQDGLLRPLQSLRIDMSYTLGEILRR
jgi:4-amino-4-deoxy-L-arabinose transferase-like glycosyltransferase